MVTELVRIESMAEFKKQVRFTRINTDATCGMTAEEHELLGRIPSLYVVNWHKANWQASCCSVLNIFRR